MKRRDFDESSATLEQQLADALEQHRATAEILRIISQSPTDVGPVLRAVADAAAGLCRAESAARRCTARSCRSRTHRTIPSTGVATWHDWAARARCSASRCSARAPRSA